LATPLSNLGYTVTDDNGCCVDTGDVWPALARANDEKRASGMDADAVREKESFDWITVAAVAASVVGVVAVAVVVFFYLRKKRMKGVRVDSVDAPEEPQRVDSVEVAMTQSTTPTL